MTSTDIHQHLWPPSFFSALARRSQPPRLRGRSLELADAPAWPLDVPSHDLDRRLKLMDRFELDQAVVSLQPTLGVDRELMEIWEDGILELAAAAGGRVIPLAATEPRRGFAGLTVAGAELLDLDALAPRLDALAESGGWLFVHPGPAVTPPERPAWWPAIVDYTAEMQAAYVGWLAAGAARWPDLDVVFAILAGGAPIQLERMAARGVEERSAMLPADLVRYGDVWASSP